MTTSTAILRRTVDRGVGQLGRVTSVSGAGQSVVGGRGPRRGCTVWQIRRATDPSRDRSRLCPGVYRFRDAHRPGDLRRQGQEPAQPADSYFQDLGGLHPRTRQMVTTAAAVEWTVVVHRGRGAAAGVLLDQGVRPPVQREVPRRQELPVPGGDAERGVPAAAGDARAEEEGRALLRAVRARLGDPRDARPAAAGLPGAHLLRRRVQAGRADRPALPARLHRQVLGPLRRPGRPARSTARIVDDFCDFMAGDSADRFLRGWSGRWCRRRRTWSTSGPPGCATTSGR